MMQLNIANFLDVLCSPSSKEPLVLEGGQLKSSGGSIKLNPQGIPLFAQLDLSDQSRTQRDHYDSIANSYLANLTYPHTQEYMAYLDEALIKSLNDETFDLAVELCCGHGEALKLLGPRLARYVGIDISENMLGAAQAMCQHPSAIFLQADAASVPLKSESVDLVVMLGGVHHVSAREGLFREVERILKPGGRFIFREPVSDFFLWKAIRTVIYRLSPMLDHETERPLVWHETVPPLIAQGLTVTQYRTVGFIGFCLFMNSDVLVFNRLFRFIPGIRAITRWSARLDDVLLRLPLLRRAGLQVIGVATKAASLDPCRS